MERNENDLWIRTPRRGYDVGRAIVFILVGAMCGYVLGVRDAGRKPAQTARLRAMGAQ